jgi:hypothetical protein
VYIFRAERMFVGECAINDNPVLATNAANLASVLLILQSEPDTNEKFQSLVREVFPSIYRVVSAPVAGSVARASVIMADTREGGVHAGIKVPLADCGTGTGQVLAILYVAVTAEASKVIIIDEPNTFLHPAAAKKLLSILMGFPHQYVITTHSADIIRTVEPEMLHLLKWEGTKSIVETIDLHDIEGNRSVLRELGVSLSDVFGADRILWVEGPTEEHCFPRLLIHLGKRPRGLSVVALVGTDDLAGPRVRASLILELYQRLSQGTALVPPTVAISLDRETRTARDMEDLDRASKGLVKFLPRRAYENYLLSPRAIGWVLRQSIPEAGPSDDQVADWLEEHRGESEHRDQYALSHSEADWRETVNAPKLLYNLFMDLSKSAVEYRKTVHSVKLTDWLLENDPEQLRELLAYVDSLVGS